MRRARNGARARFFVYLRRVFASLRCVFAARRAGMRQTDTERQEPMFTPISSFEAMTAHLHGLNRRFRVAVVCGGDSCTLSAVRRAVAEGFAEAIFVGGDGGGNISVSPIPEDEPHARFVPADSPEDAAGKAVCMVREGEADVLMKGLIHTDTLLRAVLNKEWGILRPGQVLTHIAAVELPAYDKLLFFSDPAVIPYPTQEQRVAQVAYMARLAHACGIEEPRIALLHCAETVSEKFPHTLGYGDICARAARGEWGRLRVDGPLDLRTACDPVALRVKGIASDLEGRADGLVFPDIEAANAVYKALPLFAGGRVAGALQGTDAPVVLSSRGDDAEAKFDSLALATVSLS